MIPVSSHRKQDWGVAQGVERLSNELKALGSNPTPRKEPKDPSQYPHIFHKGNRAPEVSVLGF
jgi:hypothetical protein